MEQYKQNHLEEIKTYKKTYSTSNREKYNRLSRERYKTDINYKLSVSIRNRINRAIKKNKPLSTFKSLGCSVDHLKKHLESQFQPGMTWENWGKFGWHIDHIIPLCTFDLADEEQFKKATHYTNLRPLWWHENLARPKRTE